ncbi:hypothetical protein ACI1US_00662 [Leucobacter sp. BZR 635]
MQKTMRQRFAAATTIAATSALLLSACSSGSPSGSGDQELENAVLMMGIAFTPRHAPLFAAKDQGFFEEEGIDLEIMPGTGSANAVSAVDSGKVDFAWADFGVTMLSIAQGSKVKQVNLLQGSSTYAVVALEKSGITDWDDLKGKTVATEASGAMPAMWPIVRDNLGFSEGDVEVIHATGDAKVPGLLAGQWDANFANATTDVPGFIDQGEDPVVLPWADQGLSVYGDGILANDKTLTERPELVKAFNRAATKGFMWACANVPETVKSFNNQIAGFSETALTTAIEMQCDARWNDENESVGLGHMSDEGVQKLIDLGGKYLGLENAAEISPADIYSSDFVDPVAIDEQITSPRN